MMAGSRKLERISPAVSGGIMPVSAMATTRAIFDRAVGTLERSYVHQTTYGRNRLSMAAGLAAVRLIERDGLVENSERVGTYLRDGLAQLKDRHEMVAEVRGRGLPHISGQPDPAPAPHLYRRPRGQPRCRRHHRP